MHTKNAIIKSARIEIERDLLTAYITLDYSGLIQNFGGRALYLSKDFTHHRMLSHAGHWLYRCMKVAGVERWEDMVGRAIRVRSKDDWSIICIGHIIDNDWFSPESDFGEVE